MAKPFYTDINMNDQEIQNVSIEKLGAHPSGAGLFEGRIWQLTTTKKYYRYDGTVIQTLADESWVTSEINKLERGQGAFDASPGLLPVAANKTVGDLTQIVNGDYWVITTAGTIVGIKGDDVLSIGDKIQYMGGGAGIATNWVGIQTNINDTTFGNIQGDEQTVNLVANIPLVITSSQIAKIHSIQIYNSAGAEIIIDVEKLGGDNQRTLTSKKSLTNVLVQMTGTR